MFKENIPGNSNEFFFHTNTMQDLFVRQHPFLRARNDFGF